VDEREDLLTRIYKRGARLRARRRILFGCIALVVAVAAALPLLATTDL